MQTQYVHRRAFLSSGAATAALFAGVTSSPEAAHASNLGGDFSFEVTRSESEWRAVLSPDEFRTLREGSTESPHTSPLIKETAAGVFCCKGCDLSLYESVWKVALDMGWVFFSHFIPRTVFTSIDGRPPSGMSDDPQIEAMIEVHCRRCASHLGHIVIADNQLVHCINGTSLAFEAKAA